MAALPSKIDRHRMRVEKLQGWSVLHGDFSLGEATVGGLLSKNTVAKHISGKVFAASNFLHLQRYVQGRAYKRFMCAAHIRSECQEIDLESVLKYHPICVCGEDELAMRLRRIESALVVHSALCYHMNIEVPTLAETLALACTMIPERHRTTIAEIAACGNRARHLYMTELGESIATNEQEDTVLVPGQSVRSHAVAQGLCADDTASVVCDASFSSSEALLDQGTIAHVQQADIMLEKAAIEDDTCPFCTAFSTCRRCVVGGG